MAALRCLGCGCTQDNACPGGCSWVKADFPLCSKCSGGPEDVVATNTAVRRALKASKKLGRSYVEAMLRKLANRSRARMKEESDAVW